MESQPQPASPPGTPDRHYGMDWLRIGAFGLLIFYHIGMFFVPWDWHVKADPTVLRATLPMFLTNGWRLSLLFVVSGYASAAILMRRPAAGRFAADRSARLMIPLLFGMAVICAPQPWVEVTFKHGYRDGFLHFWLTDYFRFGELDGLIMPTWQHLWFVVYLWVYTMVLALGWRVFGGARERSARAMDAVFGRPTLLIALPIGWLLLKGLVIWPGSAETHGLFDDLPAHAVYFPMFLFGFGLFGAHSVWAAIGRVWRPAALVALAAFAVVGAIDWRFPGNTPIPEPYTQVFVAARAVNGWMSILALLGIADRFWNRNHPWRATLTEAVFPFYLIHQTIIVVVAWWCLNAGLGNAVSFVILVVATALGCWLFYRIGREVPGLRLLIGLRGWRKPLVGHDMQSVRPSSAPGG